MDRCVQNPIFQYSNIPAFHFARTLLHRHDLHVMVVTILNLADVIDRLLTAAVTITHLLATVLEGIRQWVI